MLQTESRAKKKGFIMGIPFVKKQKRWWRLREKLQALPVLGIFPVISPAFITEACLSGKNMSRSIGFVPIMTTFYGASTGEVPDHSISG